MNIKNWILYGFKVMKTRHFSKLVARLRFSKQYEVHFKIFNYMTYYKKES
jgi:hypothetical protein